MAFFSDTLKKIRKPVDALKDFLTPKERTSLQERERVSPVARMETKPFSFEYQPPSLEGLKGFAASLVLPKEAFKPMELAPRETPEERAARLVKARETTKKIAEFGKAVLRATPRAAASLTLEAQGRRTMIPETKAEKFLFGQEPLESITERIERFPERAKEFGIKEPTAKKIAPFAVFGLTALDILPPLPGKGIAKQTAKELAKKYGDDVAKQIIKKGGKKLVEEAIQTGGEKAVQKAGIAAPFIREFKYELPAHLVPAKGKPTWNIGKTLWNTLRSGNVHGRDLGRSKGGMSWIIDRLSGGDAELGDLLKKYGDARSTNKQYRKLYAVLKSKNYSIDDYKKAMSELKGIEPVVIEHKLTPAVAELKAAISAKPAIPGIPKELESFVPKVGKHKDVNSFIREIADDTYAPEFRNPIADFWRKKYVQPLSKGSKATFSTDVVAFERNLDDVLTEKYTKDQLANMSVRQKAEIVNGKEWTNLYADMLDNNLFKFQTDFFKTAQGASPARPTTALKEAAVPGVHSKKLETGIDEAYQALQKADKDDVYNLGKVGDYIADPKVREQYKDVLDTPLYAKRQVDMGKAHGSLSVDPKGKPAIVLSDGLTADMIDRTLVEELTHASQFKKGVRPTKGVPYKEIPEEVRAKKAAKHFAPKTTLEDLIEEAGLHRAKAKQFSNNDLEKEFVARQLGVAEGIEKAIDNIKAAKPTDELKKILYHGTDFENVPKIQKGGFKTGGFLAHGYPQGVYFTTTKREAQNYGQVIRSTTKLKLSDFFDVSKHKELNNLQGPKYVQKLNQIIRETAESRGMAIPEPTAKQLKQYTDLIGDLKDPLDISDIKTATLQKLGYKGFIAAEKGIGKEIVIFDPKDIVVGGKPSEALKAAVPKVSKELQPLAQDLKFVKSLFKDTTERGIKTREGLVFSGNNLDVYITDVRQKLSSRGYKEVGGTSLLDEGNRLVKDGAELNFEKNGRAINVYMRTDGKKTAITFDETPMDTLGKLHTGDNYIPEEIKNIYKQAAIGKPSEALKAVRHPDYKKVFDEAIKKGMTPTDAANYAIKNVAVSDIAPELRTLAEKARKARNVDEFIKAEHPAFPVKKGFAFEQEKGISYITKDTKPHGAISVDSSLLVPSEGIGKEVIDKVQVGRVKAQIAKGEKIAPIAVRYSKDKQGYFLEVVDGHHRLTAAQEMGIKEIPFVFDTKRSLTDFYNQAVRGVSESPEMLKVATKTEGAAKPISQLENESAIAELKAKFKSVEQKNVPISEIRNFPSVEGREIVENAKKEILEGKRFPLVLEKITEGKNAGKYKVLDGNYRAQAYKELGIKDAPAITQASAPVFEHGKPVTAPVIRQAQKGFENTDKFRGGTWYSTPESKTFDFTRLGEKAERGVGGPKKIESTLEIKKPLVIKDAIPEDGSFSVINSGYENFLPKKHQELGNELYERIFGERGLMDKSLDEALGPKEMKWANQDILTDIGKKLGLTETRAKSVAQSTNGYDAMMDLIIGDGLKQKGYDALILENSYKGKVVDRHIFKFAEAEKATPVAELKEALKTKAAPKLPDIPEIKGAKVAADLGALAKAKGAPQEIIGEYQKRISTQPTKKAATPIKKTLDDTYTAIIDRFHPITKLARKATDLRPGENPELLARRYLGIQGIAESKLFWNTTHLTAEGNLEVTGPGLSKILRPAKDNIDDLRTLMIAERDTELAGRTLESGKKVTGTTPEKSAEVINALKQKYGEQGFAQLTKTAQGVREWSRKALLDPLLEVGAISKEQYDTITKSNKFYVPFQRVIEELETHGFVPKKANIFMPRSVPVKKLKGSTRDIVDPFESMITNAYKVTDFVERARVGRSIANLRKVSPELADMIKPISPKIVPVAKHGEELIFRPSFFAPDKNTIMVFENGKRKFYQVPEDVFKAVSGMMESDAGAIMKVLAFPARTLRAGATLTPEFMGRNPFRDQFTAFVFSKYGYVPGVDLVKGIFNTVGKTDLHGRWLAGGGAHSMFVSLDRMTSQATLAKVLGAKDIKGMVKNPIEALRMLSEFGEKGTRVGAFGRAVKKGVSDLEAAFESRDITLDFARRGSQTRAVNMLVAFWNAQVQGLNKTVRAFRERPMQTTFKAASGITLPSVLLYLNNRNDPRYQELPQWQKDLFWILPIGDKGPIIRIPKPFEVGIIFGTVPEHILTWMDKNDPEALTSAAKTFMEASAPGYIPTGLQPIIENVANYSFFRQRPIVSEGKQALPKELQAERYTSESAKKIGKLIKQSPAKIENLFVSYTGGLGKYALDASDKLLKTLGVVSPPSEPSKTLADRPFLRAFVAREPIGSGSESVNKFYKIYDEANATKAAVKGLAEEGKEQEAINYLRSHPAGFYTKGFNKVARTFSDLRKKRDAVLDSRELTPEQKKRAVDALDRIMTEIARQTVELVKESNEKLDQ